MEDVSDLPFRLICKRLGADIVYTEFINAEGLTREDPAGPRRTFHKLDFAEEERPMGIQVYGASELSMEKATAIAAAKTPDLIDINCGCWVKNVALRGAGAGLLLDLDRMRQVVHRVVSATDLPVTVKTRLGWDAHTIRILEVARMLEDLGVQALTIHCRTRDQGHKGDVDYSWIPRLKEAVSMPIIVNGDILTPQDVEHAFTTGCDAIMIGRGAIQHPWIFREARHYLATGEYLPPPTVKERAALCIEHLDLAMQYKGERPALNALKRHYGGYFKGLPRASHLRGELASIKEVDALRDRLLSLGQKPATAPQPLIAA
jgi:tRNA-dihydrouridine synthase B